MSMQCAAASDIAARTSGRMMPPESRVTVTVTSDEHEEAHAVVRSRELSTTVAPLVLRLARGRTATGRVLDPDGKECAPGQEGAVVIRLPLPPGTLPTLFKDDERFVRSYLSRYDGCYLTGDGGYFDDDGYLYVMGRVDDVINVAGHRLSTGAMEEVCATHPDVAECAVIGVADALKGQIPCGFLVLKSNSVKPHGEIEREVVGLVRDQIGPVAAFKMVLCVKRLPKTRSGKILRGTMQKIADHEEWKMPATIDDPAILDEIGEALRMRTA